MVQINDKRLDNVYYVNSSLDSPYEHLLKTYFKNKFNTINSIKNIKNNSKVMFSTIIKIVKTLKGFNSYNRHYITLKDLDQDQKHQVFEYLKKLVPSVFQDGVLNFDLLKQHLNPNELVVENKNFFGLNWNGKSDAWLKSQKDIKAKTLLPDVHQSLNFNQAKNILIQGDNLEALKILQSAYQEQVDVIYIDPPYNTGNDFVYNDNFKQDSYEYKITNNLIDEQGLKTTTNQKTDGRIHSNWLSMIYPRLMIARNLLKDSGVIFISIDHKEQAHLKIICDEIFGSINFVTALTWVKKHGPGGNTSFDYKIINNTEYILCYAKNINQAKFNYLVHDQKRLKQLGYVNKDQYFDERGYYKLTHLYHPSSSGSFKYIESLDYPIVAPDGTEFKLHCNKNGQTNGAYTWSYETYLAGNKLGFIECHKNSDGDWVAFRKQYQFVKFDVKKKEVIKIEAGQPYENLIDDFYSQEGGAEIREIFGDKNIFDFPKPKGLIKHLLKMSSNPNSLVLDFFAGSGTTAQAVMELNQEDGGNRKYILVQLPEPIENNPEFKKIADVTRARITRSIEKYQYNDLGFKYFKVGPTNFPIWKVSNQDDNDLIEKQLDLFLETPQEQNYEAMLYELMLKVEIRLDENIQIHQIDDYQFWADEFFDYLFFLKPTKPDNLFAIIKKIIENKEQEGKTRIYINETYFDDLKGDEIKLNLAEQINQYKKESKKEIQLVVV